MKSTYSNSVDHETACMSFACLYNARFVSWVSMFSVVSEVVSVLRILTRRSPIGSAFEIVLMIPYTYLLTYLLLTNRSIVPCARNLQ